LVACMLVLVGILETAGRKHRNEQGNGNGTHGPT
jgi:hypothetical protein